jgi:hypothetical protein
MAKITKPATAQHHAKHKATQSHHQTKQAKPVSIWWIAVLAGAASLTLAEILQMINLGVRLPFYIVAVVQLIVAGFLTQELFKGQKVRRAFVLGATVTVLVELSRIALSAIVAFISGWSRVYNHIPNFGYGSTTAGSVALTIALGALLMLLAVYLSKRYGKARPNLIPGVLLGLVAVLVVLPLSFLLFIVLAYHI